MPDTARTRTPKPAPPGPAPAARTPDPGEAVTLAGATYHLATLTGHGARALAELAHNRLAASAAFAEPPSAGAILYQSAVQADLGGVPGVWERLREALDLIVFEALPAEIERDATPAEVIATLDAGIAAACLDWLEAILKNLSAQRARMSADPLLRAVSQALTAATATPPAGGTAAPPTSGSAS